MLNNVRLYALISREAPFAVLFRRGPSKRVLLIKWNTSDDTFEEGQWFKGRIYERRCDLSPDGEFLLYFAANHRKPFYFWSAVSRPPYLTALALWPKDNAWGGGGHFHSGDHLLLNHRETEMGIASGFHVPSWLQVSPFGQYSGLGEDDPIYSERLQREGWNLTHEGIFTENPSGAKVWITVNPHRAWEKPHPKFGRDYVLRYIIKGLKEKEGPWYLTGYTVIDANGKELVDLGPGDWADWLPNGDLCFTINGKLYRIQQEANGFNFEKQPVLIADFSDRTFCERKAPASAIKWNG